MEVDRQPDDYQTQGEMLQEQFRLLSQSKQVMDWWAKQLNEIRVGYQGATHSINRAIADSEKHKQWYHEKIQGYEERIESLEAERNQLSAMVGELTTELKAISARVHRIAEWANKQQQQQNGRGDRGSAVAKNATQV